MIPRFVNLIIKIDIPKKQMLDITMILLWAHDDFVKYSIEEASFVDVITSAWKIEQND